MMPESLLSTTEALELLLSAVHPILEMELVPIRQANGRVLAQDLISGINVPPWDNSSMDGYAVQTADCQKENTILKVVQRIPAGKTGKPLKPGEAARIFTGAPVPEGADAIVMQEACHLEGNKVMVEVIPKLGEWVRRAGEDIKKEDCILNRGRRLQPQHIGLAASIGMAEIPVCRHPKVAVFFTGDELVMPGEALSPGKIYNSNQDMVCSMLDSMGCRVTNFGIIPDNLQATKNILQECANGHDLIIASGGVSVGDEDYIKPAIEAQGMVNFWQVAVKPGKPLMLGSVTLSINSLKTGHTIPFIGLPGNPVSIFVMLLLFIRPFLLRMQGAEDIKPKTIPMRADFSTHKMEPRNEFLRAKINGQGGLDLYENQSSGVLTSAVWGDGLIDNPPMALIEKGSMVNFIPFNALLYT